MRKRFVRSNKEQTSNDNTLWYTHASLENNVDLKWNFLSRSNPFRFTFNEVYVRMTIRLYLRRESRLIFKVGQSKFQKYFQLRHFNILLFFLLFFFLFIVILRIIYILVIIFSYFIISFINLLAKLKFG